MCSHKQHINVVVSTVPHRFDIDSANQLKDKYNLELINYISDYKENCDYSERIKVLDFDQVINDRDLYTVHMVYGLHLNIVGKTKLAKYVSELVKLDF